MRYTQFLVFEVGSACNLSDHHQRCPSWTPDRYGDLDVSAEITDAEIKACIREAYLSLGFAGHVAWHYYNEPMLQWDRIVELMEGLKADPELGALVKFTLWTNGTLLEKPDEEKPETGTRGLDLLSQVWVSNYQKHVDKTWLRDHVPDVRILDGGLDNRRDPLELANVNGCLRPFNELIVDNYGNGHLCCADWQGTAGLGNIRTEGFAAVCERYRIARLGCADSPMDPLPPVCVRCRIRQTGVGDLVAAVRDRTIQDRPWEVLSDERENDGGGSGGELGRSDPPAA